VQGLCGSGSTTGWGYAVVDPNDVDDITSMTLHDFRIDFDQSVNIVIPVPGGGSISAVISGFQMFSNNKGTVFGPVPVINDRFAFPGQTSVRAGVVTYSATGSGCALLQSMSPSTPCSGGVTLSGQPAVQTSIAGLVTAPKRVFRIDLPFDETFPVDASNPALGTIRFTGLGSGFNFVPVPFCQADLTGDFVINVSDLVALLGQFGSTVPLASGADFNSDGVVNIIDLTRFLGLFGTECPDH
jgi:hypothetical protein